MLERSLSDGIENERIGGNAERIYVVSFRGRVDGCEVEGADDILTGLGPLPDSTLASQLAGESIHFEFTPFTTFRM